MNENKAIRTDLASEAVEGWEDTEGVRCESREAGRGVRVTRVRILSESAAKRFGRPQGNYATIDAPGLSENDPALNERVICAFAEELGEFVKGLKEEETVLVAGLGNRAITADALGPQTAEKVLVSRKITEFLPDAMEGKVRPVCAVAPGVLGVTGIETGEILKGVAERVRPQLILAVDALASRSTERIANSIQITDTGICPGSGLGNNRAGLSEQTMGLPVVAIGVPTVVHASTISQDAVDLLLDEMGEKGNRETLLSLVGKVVSEKIGPLIVTPKDIDVMSERLSGILAQDIDLCLHGLSLPKLRQLLV